MNKIVTNRGTVDPWHMAEREDGSDGCVQIAPGFEDKAIMTVNQPPPQHDWSQANSRLSELREEFAGMEPIQLKVSVKLQGSQEWFLNLPKVPRKIAKQIRRQIFEILGDSTMELDRDFQVGDK